MHNQHIMQCIMQCVVSVVYVVICNAVRLIIGKVTLLDVISTGQTNINQFFSASRNFCGVSGLRFSRLGPGLAAIFVAAAA